MALWQRVIYIFASLQEPMRKVGTVLVALALVALTVPAFAAAPVSSDEPFTGVPGGPGGHVRSNDCPGTIVWDTGMFDEFTPPTGCSSAGSVGCFVNAINDGAFPEDGRRIGDDFIANDASPITHVKVWARYSASGNAYHLATPGSVHGFCVKFYEALDNPPVCPDGTVEGEGAIGAIAYQAYAPTFTEYEITSGVPRNWNYCIELPTPFVPTAGRVYYASVSADFDFTTYDDPGTPAADPGVTQFFWRVYPGLGYNPYCEASWWDTWNSPATNWNAISVAVAIPCWAGWDAAFVLYSNYFQVMGACCTPDGICTVVDQLLCTPPNTFIPNGVCTPNPCGGVNPTEKTTWGSIKHNFK